MINTRISAAVILLLSTAISCGREAGQPCEREGQCRSGLYCIKQKCYTPKRVQEPCEDSQECDRGLNCMKRLCLDPDEPRAEGFPCKQSGECASGLICLDATCYIPSKLNQSCNRNEECVTGLLCYGAICVDEARKAVRRVELARSALPAYDGCRGLRSAIAENVILVDRMGRALDRGHYNEAEQLLRQAKVNDEYIQKSLERNRASYNRLLDDNPVFLEAVNIALEKTNRPNVDPRSVNPCQMEFAETIREHLGKIAEGGK